MSVRFKYIIFRLPAVFIFLSLLYACANIGNPNGGPYDEKPPKVINSKPAMNQLNFKGKSIEVMFDEFISVDNPSENVIVTPPQKQSPIIQAIGKKISVELKDTLKENTTYTIDFTSAIADNNEKNMLENFSFAFSTGDVLDTLQISGYVYDAHDIEPIQKMIVGIHSDLTDTAFTKTPFLRTSKTDDKGHFVIHNVSPGSYHIFVLEDKNRNYMYDKNADESLAYLDSIIIPSCERKIVPDSIWKDTIINKIDTITFDSIAMVEKTIFYPNNLILSYFKDSITPRQRMYKPERLQNFVFTLKFNAPLDTFPYPVPLNFDAPDSSWFVTQLAEDPEYFAINYWILDSAIYNLDTLMVEVTYWKNNDTLPDIIELQIDTLSLVNKETAQKKKDNKKKPSKLKKTTPKDTITTDSVTPIVQRTVPLQMSINPTGSINPFDVVTITFAEPVLEVRKDFFRLDIAVDTLWNNVDFEFEKDSLRSMTYMIKREFKYEEKYRLIVDSALLCGIYNHYNDSTCINLTVKGEKDYGHLNISVKGLPLIELDSATSTMLSFIEILNRNGEPIRKAIVENGNAVFRDLPADKYYARIIFDNNGNGVWNAGSYENKTQPEQVFYCMKQFEIRQNWTIEEIWDVSTAKAGEKPFEILKNKPKETQHKQKRNYREESNPRRSGNSTMPNIGGIGGMIGK